MDVETVSACAAGGALAVRIGAVYLQSRFPDSRKIRNIHIPSMALAALSYAVRSLDKGVALYAGAGIRSAVRATRFGARHRNLVGTFMTTAIGVYTAATYSEPEDVIPFVSFAVGTAGDMSPQGRYMRLAFMSAMAGCAVPYALMKENYMMAATEVVSAAMLAKAIVRHDIEEAAGPGRGFFRNVRAYLHGIFNRSATGAAPETQVNTDHLDPKIPADMEVIEARYEENLERRPNPYYSPQSGPLSGPWWV